MYLINEIFQSLQGEGFNSGTASVFIRFGGCNLHCTFCDTIHENGIMMSLPQIIEEVNRFPRTQLIVLTGGEPALQVDDVLVEALKSLTGKRIAIETNGTHTLPKGIDWITLSPKTAFEGGMHLPCILNECNELKVVYLGQDLSQYNHIKTPHRFLQPCYSNNPIEREQNMIMTVSAVLSHPEWRLSLQTHRILNIK